MKRCKLCGTPFAVNFNQRYCSTVCSRQAKKQQSSDSHDRYYLANAEKVKARSKAWYNSNKERASAACKAYRAKNREAIASSRFKAKYGIDMESYKELEAQQNGVCAICGGKDRDSRNRPLSVDHDHTTGKVRGLLCGHCNKALGLLNDDLLTVGKALRYMENHYQNPTIGH